MAGNITVLKEQDTGCFVGVAVLKGKCALSDLLDEEVYKGKDAKYNKYEFPIERYGLFPKPVSYEEVARFCGIPAEDKTSSNIYKGFHGSHAVAFYGKAGEPSLILDRFHALALSWVAKTMYRAAQRTLKNQKQTKKQKHPKNIFLLIGQ